MNETTQQYYTIIPAAIRLDKGLSMYAKLLYGEILALSRKTGTCFASNQYFSSILDANTRTIQRALQQLIQGGYITVTHQRDPDTKCYQQRLITPTPLSGLPTPLTPPSRPTSRPPHVTTVAYNKQDKYINNNSVERKLGQLEMDAIQRMMQWGKDHAEDS